MPFQLNAKNVFLTYAQAPANWTKEQLLADLPPGFTKHIVAHELHKDGGHHYHCLLHYPLKCRTKNPRFFDIGQQHPKVEGARVAKDTAVYCRKDGDFLELGEWDSVESPWTQALQSTSRDEFMSTVATISPRDYILRFQDLQYFADEKYNRSTAYISRFKQFDVPDVLSEWVAMCLMRPRPDRPKSLWISGSSRLGKTEWARSLGQHIYWNGQSNIDCWDSDAGYLILDDFNWDYVPSKKALIGAQLHITLTDKYRKKRSLEWGNPCIYLCNQDQDVYHSCKEREWLRANCVYVELNKPLY